MRAPPDDKYLRNPLGAMKRGSNGMFVWCPHEGSEQVQYRTDKLRCQRVTRHIGRDVLNLSAVLDGTEVLVGPTP